MAGNQLCGTVGAKGWQKHKPRGNHGKQWKTIAKPTFWPGQKTQTEHSHRKTMENHWKTHAFGWWAKTITAFFACANCELHRKPCKNHRKPNGFLRDGWTSRVLGGQKHTPDTVIGKPSRTIGRLLFRVVGTQQQSLFASVETMGIGENHWKTNAKP